MKKIIFLLSTIAMIGIFGCKKMEGPVGPAGPQGPAGVGGTSIVAVDTFVVTSSQWVNVSTLTWEMPHTNTAITQEIVNTGAIMVYSKRPPTYPNWYAWPDVVAGTGQKGYRFMYNKNTVTLIADNYSSAPPTETIKVVIMK